MYRIVVALFRIIFVVGAHGAARKIPASIHKDAIAVTQNDQIFKRNINQELSKEFIENTKTK
jgi:hypothetical protein